MHPRAITAASMSTRIGGTVARAVNEVTIRDASIHDAIVPIHVRVIDRDPVRRPPIAPASRANQAAPLAIPIRKSQVTIAVTATAVADGSAAIPGLDHVHMIVAAPIIGTANFLFSTL